MELFECVAHLNGSVCSEGLLELVDLLERLIENWYGGLERLLERVYFVRTFFF